MEIATEVFGLERELSVWLFSLAPPLCIRSYQTVVYDEQVSGAERFRVILSLRYLNLQILLHRAFIARALDVRVARDRDNENMSSADRLASGSIQTCIQSAEQVISIIHSIVSANRAHDLLGAWWFSLYYGKSDNQSCLLGGDDANLHTQSSGHR